MTLQIDREQKPIIKTFYSISQLQIDERSTSILNLSFARKKTKKERHALFLM